MAIDTMPKEWLFVFKKEQNQGDLGNEFLFKFVDFSTNEQSFNLFDMNVDDADMPLGDFFYSVYQMPNETEQDFTLGHLVERGKMRLIEEPLNVATYNVENNRTIYVEEFIS